MGGKVEAEADPQTPLLWVLRDTLGLTGTKFGCGMALCGACTVHMDGRPIRSCVTPLSAVGAARSRRSKGLSGDRSHPVQRAWIELDVPQCGYCQSGQIMSAAALLSENPSPTDADIDAAMSRQYLSLRHLSAYPRGDPSRRPAQGRLSTTDVCEVSGHESRSGSRRHRPDAAELPQNRGARIRRASACAASARLLKKTRGERGRRCGAARAKCLAAHRRRRHDHLPVRQVRDGPGCVHGVADAARRGTRRRS